MKIEKNKWVAIHYTLKDDDGNLIDSSTGGAPLGYLHGNGYLIRGLENALENKTVGDKFTCKIPPKDAYGEYDPELIIDVDKDQFDSTQPIEPGMKFQVMTSNGPAIVSDQEVTEDKVKINANHELAGKNLNFDVEVIEVRDPTED